MARHCKKKKEQRTQFDGRMPRLVLSSEQSVVPVGWCTRGSMPTNGERKSTACRVASNRLSQPLVAMICRNRCSDGRCERQSMYARLSRRQERACIIITEKRAVFIGMCVYICIDMYVDKRMNDQRKSTRLASFARIDHLLSSLGHRAKSLGHRGAAAQALHPFRGV